MDLSDYLDSTSLMSCAGTITHRLTLLPSGRVEIEIGSVTALVDPATRTVIRPRGYTVPDEVLNHAAALARTSQR